MCISVVVGMRQKADFLRIRGILSVLFAFSGKVLSDEFAIDCKIQEDKKINKTRYVNILNSALKYGKITFK